MEIENALYESKYVEGVWNTINNIAQNGVKNGIKKTVQDFTQKKANIENKITSTANEIVASKNFMTNEEWQTFINSVGTFIQKNDKKLSPKSPDTTNKNASPEKELDSLDILMGAQ